MSADTMALAKLPASEEVREPDQSLAITRRSFAHLTDWHRSELELEAFLKARGHPPHCHVADLIMFMERSFKGAYLRGRLSHYQRVMPSAGWPPGDSLSEKLKRCNDKETFRSRFNRIGVTEVMRRGHFESYEVQNIDFKGCLYLRLIDTKNRNLSFFYRNDDEVEAFFRAARTFAKESGDQHRSVREKAEMVYRGKAAVIATKKAAIRAAENPASLLAKGIQTEATKEQAGRLTLVHSSSGKESKREGKTESEVPVELPGAFSPEAQPIIHLLQGKSVSSGLDVYRLWRSTLRAHDATVCITDSPTPKQLQQAELFGQRFSEYFLKADLPEFFRWAAEEWRNLKQPLKEAGFWKLADYPELGSLAEFSDKVLTLYKRTCERRERKNEEGPRQKSVKPRPVHTIKPPYQGCERVTGPGRTFLAGEPESVEYQVAAFSRPDECRSEVQRERDRLNRTGFLGGFYT